MKEKIYTENTKEKNAHYASVYCDNGSGYVKEDAERYMIDSQTKKCRLFFSDQDLVGCRELRIDPIECTSVIKIHRLEAETEKFFRKLTVDDITINGKYLSQGLVVFSSENPQMIIPIPEKESWKSLCLEFEILCAEIAPLQEVFQAYEWELIQVTKSYEEKYLQLMTNCQREDDSVSNREQLLHDKLAYIEGTTVYRKLLKTKVDAVGLWNELDG